MDFGLYARVLWRFKLLVLLGLILALSLATLTMVRVSSDGLSYRQTELWTSTARVGITQSGFPWGRLFAQESTTQVPTDAGIPVADPNRLNNLAVLYAELAMSDPVRRLIRADGPVVGQIIATPLVRGDNRIMLPLIDLTSIAASPRDAMDLSHSNRTGLAHVRGSAADRERCPP